MKKVWGRIGMTVTLTDEEYLQLLNGSLSDSKIIKAITSTGQVDGETYFIDDTGEELENGCFEL